MGHDNQARLLEVIAGVAAELHNRSPGSVQAGLDDRLEHDLGIDSLGRVELLARLEKTFNTILEEQMFNDAETPRDLLRALHKHSARPEAAAGPGITSSAPRHSGTPDTALTLTEMLDWHVQQHPDQVHIRLYSDEQAGETISYRQLHNGASAVAAGLQGLGVLPGDSIAIMLPTGTDYFYSFFGILLAGAVPVPIYPPVRRAQLEDHLRQQSGILANCRAVVMVTLPEALKVARLLGAQLETMRHVVTVDKLMDYGGLATPVAVRGDDTAFLQYTSGSTGNPKGVILSHANLLANIRADGTAIRASADDVFISWLPLYHDMGLIGAWLGSLYHGVLLVIMSPLAFLSQPKRWLWALHRYRGSISAAPNFGYELCLSRIEDSDLEGLDLSRWRVAFNGAEAVSPHTLQRFSERFTRYGFRTESMYPVYGLAESSLGVCFPPLGRGPMVDRIEREAFMKRGQALPTMETSVDALRFVACGLPLPGHQVRITDARDREQPERWEGHVQIRGPSVTSGYYRNPEATRTLFRGDWLDSGDLGYIAGGELYITGRAKDVIIRAGRNIYPHELEENIGTLDGIRKGCVAVFGSRDPASETERLVVMAETRKKDPALLENLRQTINSRVTDLAGTPPDEVLLTPPNTILKTSSGKIRRAASRQLFENRQLGESRPSLGWQLVRLALSGLAPGLRRLAHAARIWLYAGYSHTLFRILAAAAFLVSLLPDAALRWRLLRGDARLLAKLTGTRLSVHGLEHLPTAGTPYVLVANHASYLDSYVLAAALPQRLRFLAKAELEQTWLSRTFLRRLDTVFVERFDRQKGVQATQELVTAVSVAPPVVVFPEGTFTRIPGLRYFHMGAFQAAAGAGVVVLPVAIRGTRSILRAQSNVPYRGAITVTVGEAISMAVEKGLDNDPWKTALELRNAARRHILRHCGEPELGEPMEAVHTLKQKSADYGVQEKSG